MLSNNLNPADQSVVASRSTGNMKMAARADTSTVRSLSINLFNWLNLQGAKFKYILKDKVNNNINSLKLVQEIDN